MVDVEVHVMHTVLPPIVVYSTRSAFVCENGFRGGVELTVSVTGHRLVMVV